MSGRSAFASSRRLPNSTGEIVVFRGDRRGVAAVLAVIWRHSESQEARRPSDEAGVAPMNSGRQPGRAEWASCACSIALAIRGGHLPETGARRRWPAVWRSPPLRVAGDRGQRLLATDASGRIDRGRSPSWAQISAFCWSILAAISSPSRDQPAQSCARRPGQSAVPSPWGHREGSAGFVVVRQRAGCGRW